MEISNSETAVIANECDCAVEVDSRQLVAMSQINCVIKEDGTTERDASRAHPPQCAIRIDDGRCETAARPFNRDIVVAQIGVILYVVSGSSDSCIRMDRRKWRL